MAIHENDGEVSRPGAKAKSYDLQHLIEEPKFYRATCSYFFHAAGVAEVSIKNLQIAVVDCALLLPVFGWVWGVPAADFKMN
uniref:Uncharacterized protein n=1 Tax=Salix viminalis TaxID=40686 RepID=A0A6N2LIJ0_SALVM